MRKAVADLLTSKRFIVALLGAVAEGAVHFGFDLSPEIIDQLSSIVLVLTGSLIAGYTVTDTGKALGKPQGVGHKD